MEQIGHRWGDPTFDDRWDLQDATLSKRGMEQTIHLSQHLIQSIHHHHSYDHLDNNNNNHNNNNHNYHEELKLFSNIIKNIDLILISPLTRCIQTYQHGVLPALVEYRLHNNISDTAMPDIYVIPLLRERVYTVADTGKSLNDLAKEFPNIYIDWDTSIQLYNNRDQNNNNNNNKSRSNNNIVDNDVNNNNNVDSNNTIDCWWYQHDDKIHGLYEEWRPCGQGQSYLVYGEPLSNFEQRMKLLEQLIQNLSSSYDNILLVTHWGVLHHLTGEEMDNCEIKQIPF